MLLYIIRHGDPIYDPDSLTPKGHLQAQALAKRLAVHGLDKIYTSPCKRAMQTAEPTCQLLGMKAEIEEWTSEATAWDEFSFVLPNGNRTWSFSIKPSDFKNDETLDRKDWYNIEIFTKVNAKKGYKRICDASDKFIEKLGYKADGCNYKIIRPNEDRVAVFCHHGFGTTWLSHLLSIPPHIFWASFDIAHSGVTIIEFKNYEDGITTPKCLCLSDLSHIYGEHLPLIYNNKLPI